MRAIAVLIPCLPRWLRAALWAALCLAPLGLAQAQPLLLDDRAVVPAWPAVTVWADAPAELTADDLAGQPQRFQVPTGTPGNLGRRTEAVWLRLPVVVPGTGEVTRVLEIDYPLLNRVDLYVYRDARLQQHHRMGNQLAPRDRALLTRAHAATLRLAPGDYELLLRVQTRSSMVLPISLYTPEAFTRHEAAAQLVQGVILGLALCMLMYSLAHWVSLRDGVFGDYALLLAGNTAFTLAYFGIGPLYLWPHWPDFGMRVAPMAIALAVVAGARFTRATLAVHEISLPVDWLLRAAGVLALLGLAGLGTGWLDYRSGQALVTVLGVTVVCVVLPVAAIRARRGEHVARYVLVGWAFYTVGALTTAGILRGQIVPSFWTQHIYPLSTLVEMAAWLAVLGLRVQESHRNADRARVESATLRTLAHTDALTGLPNRRGLQEHLAAALRQCGPGRMLAVYLMDLDGFKKVNDQHGHDVGDALLVAVGERLQAQLRGPDVVARLGGDEFVVLAEGLSGDQAAKALGHKLLAAFACGFEVQGRRCEVGLTVGYTLAPLDGSSADELLKRADAAMYVGKQEGGRQLQRGGRVTLDVSGVRA